MSESVELFLFEVGGERFGADATQVLRVDSVSDTAVRHSALGELRRAQRAIVYSDHEGTERAVVVDAVFGLRVVEVNQLRRLPRLAQCGALSVGAWLDGEQAVMLIDLRQLSS